MHRFVIGKALGEGAFGDVHLGQDKKTGEKFAIKTLKDRVPRLEKFMAQPEVKALRQLKHPNIVECKHFFWEEEKNRAHLVFEFMDMGSLESICRHRKDPFSEHELRSIFFQILTGLSYIHQNHYIHRDMKPENILVKSGDADPIVKLADLGLAKFIGGYSRRPRTTYVATRWYRSPELLLKLGDYGAPSDIWALGAIMVEVINLGEPLFPGDGEDDMLSRIIRLRGHPATVSWKAGERKLRERKGKHMPHVEPSSLRRIIPRASDAMLNLIEDMLEVNPLLRPTAQEALTSTVFRMTAERPMSDMQSLMMGDGEEDLYDEFMEDDFYAPPLYTGRISYASSGKEAARKGTAPLTPMQFSFNIPPRSGKENESPQKKHKWSPAGCFNIQ